LGLTNLRLGQAGPAVQSFRRAIELLPADQPEHWDAVVKLCEIFLLAQNPQYRGEVESYTNQLIKRDPNSFDGHRLLGDLDYARASEAFRTARGYDGRRQLDDAIAEYRKADSAKAGDQGVSMQLARSLTAKGEFANAEALYRGVLEKDKTFPAAYTE